MTGKGRLTRQELGWLLTQQAQGAAERLRRGMQVLVTQAPPPLDSDPGLDATLDALDGTMKMLSSLHQGAQAPRGQKRRFDLAAMLYEVAPHARVSIEPGSGTEVFGEEGELRRLLHVLIGPEERGGLVTVRREGDDVRIDVLMGPDTPATSETERSWLHRMALRYGGRYELEGSTEALFLPADRAEDHEPGIYEAPESRRGEALARDLAASIGFGSDAASPKDAVSSAVARECVLALARVSRTIAQSLATLVVDLGREASSPVRLAEIQALIAQLSVMGAVEVDEPPVEVDLVQLVRDEVASFEARPPKAGVVIELHVQERVNAGKIRARVAPKMMGAIVRELLIFAVLVTPEGGQVKAYMEVLEEGSPVSTRFRLAVENGGPDIREDAEAALISLEAPWAAMLRPHALALFFARSMAGCQGASLLFENAPSGRGRVLVSLAV